MRTNIEFKWSSRNQLPSGRWGTWFYAQGTEMATGQRVYYGKSEWSDEASAIKAQEEWENRIITDIHFRNSVALKPDKTEQEFHVQAAKSDNVRVKLVCPMCQEEFYCDLNALNEKFNP